MLSACRRSARHLRHCRRPERPRAFRRASLPWHYFLAQGPVIWRYLRLLAIPYGFTVDSAVSIPPAWFGLAAWSALALLLALAWRSGRAWAPWLMAGFVLCFPARPCSPRPTSQPTAACTFRCCGFATAAALALARFRVKAMAPALVAALTLVALARTQVWMSEETLWREAVERAPGKVRPKIQLARQLPPGDALALLAEARRLAPNDPAVAAETGKVLLAGRRPAQALAEFGRALALDPRDARNYNNRGVALAALGQTAPARQDFVRALALDPHLADARENLSRLAP